MGLIEQSVALIGANKTSYILTFIGISLWFLGNTLGAEDKKLSFGLITLWRGLVVCVIAFILMRYDNIGSYIVPPQESRYMLQRGFTTTFYCITFIVSLRYLPNPVVQTITNGGPILVLVLDALMNGRKVTQNEVVGTTVACVSLLLTIYSSSLHNTKKSNFDYIEVSALGKALVIILSLLSLVGWAYGVIITKRIKSAGSVVINYHLGLWSIFGGGLVTIIEEKEFPFDVREYAWIAFVVSGAMALSGFMYIQAIKITENVSTLTLINFVTVIEAYFFSFFRYGEELSVLGIIGSIGIFVSLVYLAKQ